VCVRGYFYALSVVCALTRYGCLPILHLGRSDTGLRCILANRSRLEVPELDSAYIFLCVLKFYILSISYAYDMLGRDVTRKFILTQNKIFCSIDVAFITFGKNSKNRNLESTWI